MKDLALLVLVFILCIDIGHAKSRTCKTFSNQAEAQKYYAAKKKGWKTLDRDKDGEACECLKGGSRYNDGRCKNWRKKNGK